MPGVHALEFALRKYCASGAFSPELEADVVGDFLTGGLRARVCANLPVQTIASARWPDGWREAVWDRFAPAWLKQRRSTRFRSIEVVQVFDLGKTRRGWDRIHWPIVLDHTVGFMVTDETQAAVRLTEEIPIAYVCPNCGDAKLYPEGLARAAQPWGGPR